MKYEKPNMVVIEFEARDVVITSLTNGVSGSGEIKDAVNDLGW